MAAKVRLINNKWCRYYRDGFIWVPEDGSAATALIDKHYKKLKLMKDDNGLWAKHPWGHYISMAQAVITCFCAPKPDDGQKYVINYKDGDNHNCSKSNLEWIPYHYQHCAKDYLTMCCFDSEVEVHRDGTIKLDGKDVKLVDSLFDPDIDRFVCIVPHIRVKEKGNLNGRIVHIDELMADAGYVNGDNAGMQYPKVLHRDNDWMNFDSDNLEWCEMTDSRYKEYENEMYKAMNARIPELNPGAYIPDFMYHKTI